MPAPEILGAPEELVVPETTAHAVGFRVAGGCGGISSSSRRRRRSRSRSSRRRRRRRRRRRGWRRRSSTSARGLVAMEEA